MISLSPRQNMRKWKGIMKNEIELKEQLLVLEANYMYIVNSGDTTRNKYWYQKEHQCKSRDIGVAMNKCKRELEILKTINLMSTEIETLKNLKQAMHAALQNNSAVPTSYNKAIQDLDDQIKEIEEQIEQISTSH